ncbi:hypothetical protein [Streptomyces sp. NPDC029721]|uniref:hypothetical protein n=1 Tax=Streptomyces sp. NPDC029721 TaxID=3157090 RepID=UPI0033D7BBEC
MTSGNVTEAATVSVSAGRQRMRHHGWAVGSIAKVLGVSPAPFPGVGVHQSHGLTATAFTTRYIAISFSVC